jgi:hypothetical protein
VGKAQAAHQKGDVQFSHDAVSISAFSRKLGALFLQITLSFGRVWLCSVFTAQQPTT